MNIDHAGKRSEKKIIAAALFIIAAVAALLVLGSLLTNSINACAAADQREAAHGMNYVKNPATGKSYLFWSDQYDSGTLPNGSWTHDIFYQEIDLNDPKIEKKKTLIRAEEAQEPASVSCAAGGTFFVTFEDGNAVKGHTIAQRYAIYDKNLNPVKPYGPGSTTIRLGGHSGHGACTKNRLVTFWSNDWIDGGGVDGLGTGRDVRVTTMDLQGSRKKTVKVTRGHKREWWPLIAASRSNTMLVWQRYVKNHSYSHVCYAAFDPAKGRLSHTHVLSRIRAKYYTYNVTYLANLKRYMIDITYGKKGAVILLDRKGHTVAVKKGLPPFVRESAPAVREVRDAALLCCPRSPRGAFTLKVTKKKVHLKRTYGGRYKWRYAGISGFYGADGDTAYFAALGSSKLELIKFR